MTLTNRHLGIAALGIGVIGLALEWKNLFGPSASSISPLSKRAIGTTPATGRLAVSATPSTAGRPSPQGATSSGGLTLGSALSPIASTIAGLMKAFGGSSPNRAPSSGGSGGATAPGGSAGSVNAGRGAPFSADPTSTAGGSVPSYSSPYADLSGAVAYPQGDGTYQDEWGNQVYITADGSISYDATQDVGYVAGGEVFPGSFDPNDPATYDYYSDGGPLAAPDQTSTPDQTFNSDYPLSPDVSLDYSDPYAGTDPTAVDPTLTADDGLSNYGGDFGSIGDTTDYSSGSYDNF